MVSNRNVYRNISYIISSINHKLTVLEPELAYYHVAGKHVIHYSTETLFVSSSYI